MAAKPFLKWVGGKGKLLEQLIPLFPKKFNNFYEPFLGGGAVFFRLEHKSSYINDINTHLINLYIHIRDKLGVLIVALKDIEVEYKSLNNDDKKEYFYAKRAEYNEAEAGSIKKSALLIFLNRTCFNGLYRENASGGFNVPYGRNHNPTICDEKNLRSVSEMLKRSVITNRSFREAIKTAKKGDFVYFDPPYYPLNATSSFTSYSSNIFLENEQKELFKVFKELDKKGCYVAMSNSDTSFIKELYDDFTIHFVYAARSINAKGDKRGKINEVLITNY